jgi:hypothetical protein
MRYFALAVALAIGVPLSASIIAAVRRQSIAGHPAGRRVLWVGAVAGALWITPLAFLFALASYGGFAVLLIGWLVGAVLGAILAGPGLLIGRLIIRHRDRTG